MLFSLRSAQLTNFFYPFFVSSPEHVWEVYVQRKGLGDSYGILGNYRLCITDKTLSLVRIGSELTPHQEKRAENVEFLLASVRR